MNPLYFTDLCLKLQWNVSNLRRFAWVRFQQLRIQLLISFLLFLLQLRNRARKRFRLLRINVYRSPDISRLEPEITRPQNGRTRHRARFIKPPTKEIIGAARALEIHNTWNSNIITTRTGNDLVHTHTHEFSRHMFALCGPRVAVRGAGSSENNHLSRGGIYSGIAANELAQFHTSPCQYFSNARRRTHPDPEHTKRSPEPRARALQTNSLTFPSSRTRRR